MVKDFDMQTKEKAVGRTRVLLLDSHSSHHSPAFMKYAKENSIVVLGYPPHCTHALQDLDIVVMGKFGSLQVRGAFSRTPNSNFGSGSEIC
jgi:hypothetical protein